MDMLLNFEFSFFLDKALFLNGMVFIFVHSNDDALAGLDQSLVEPRMVPDLMYFIPVFRVDRQEELDHVSPFGRHETRDFVLSRANFLIKLAGVSVLKGQIPTNHGKEDDPAAPDVGAQAHIALSVYHLGRRIAWAPASRFQSFSFTIKV